MQFFYIFPFMDVYCSLCWVSCGCPVGCPVGVLWVSCGCPVGIFGVSLGCPVGVPGHPESPSYLCRSRSWRRCPTRSCRPSPWCPRPCGVAGSAGAGWRAGWTRWRRCRPSGPSPWWAPGRRNQRYRRSLLVQLSDTHTYPPPG